MKQFTLFLLILTLLSPFAEVQGSDSLRAQGVEQWEKLMEKLQNLICSSNMMKAMRSLIGIEKRMENMATMLSRALIQMRLISDLPPIMPPVLG